MIQDVVNYLVDGLNQGYSLQELQQKLFELGYSEDQINQATSQITRSSPSSKTTKKIGFFLKIWMMLISPKKLFLFIKDEQFLKVLTFQFKLLALILFIFACIFILFFSLTSSLSNIPSLENLPLAEYMALLGILFIPLLIIFMILFIFIMIPLMTIISALILHIIIKIFGGKSSYTQTYKVLVYASVPSNIFGFIPIVNLFLLIWYFILSIIGVSIYHQISKLRSFLALITPLVIFVLLFIYLINTIELKIPSTQHTTQQNIISNKQDIKNSNHALTRTTYDDAVLGNEIFTCIEIRHPGLYALKNDLKSSETCLKIHANNVTINGNGYEIIGDSQITKQDEYIIIPDYGILNKADNVTIKNFKNISGFGVGISTLSQNANIINNNISNNLNIGIKVYGKNNKIQDNQIEQNGLNSNFTNSGGVMITNQSYGNIIRDNTFLNNQTPIYFENKELENKNTIMNNIQK